MCRYANVQMAEIKMNILVKKTISLPGSGHDWSKTQLFF